MTAKPMRQRKIREGDVFAISLGDGTHGFGQVSRGGDYAFFDLRRKELPDIAEVVRSPIAFRVPMVGDSAREGRWISLGNAPLLGALAQEASYWNQPVGSNQLRICRGTTFVPATAAEVGGLELMAWWYEGHVVQRLIDHFEGRQNPLAESFKIIKIYDQQTGRECGTLTP